MPRSPHLQKQISVMARIERAMDDLPDERARSRVITWFLDEYVPDSEPLPTDPSGKTG